MLRPAKGSSGGGAGSVRLTARPSRHRRGHPHEHRPVHGRRRPLPPLRPAGATPHPYNAAERVRVNRYTTAENVGPMGPGFLVYTVIPQLRCLFQSAEMTTCRASPACVVVNLLLATD